MISVKPVAAFDFHCPKCTLSVVTEDTLFFQGMHVLAECTCSNCDFIFYHTLPIGHDLLFPIRLSINGTESFYPSGAKEWLALPLLRAIRQQVQKNFQIKIQVNKSCDQVVIVNCLDTCFGHIFTKVWNCYTLLESKPDWGVIAILPERCAWLLPPQVAEVWAVAIPLKDCNQTIGGLDEFVKDQLDRFDTVSLSHTYTHLDHTRYLAMEKILKVSRFDLGEFYSAPPQITFVLREDRFWLNSRLLDLLYKASRKFGMEQWSKHVLSWRQRQLVNRTAKTILKSLPNARLACTGLGKSGRLSNPISDHRSSSIVPETEILWNGVYAKSHIVIGVHGSHMLIPSALAAGFINIVPRFKIPHLVEDTVLPYSNRLLQFMGRFLDECSSPGLAASHAVGVVRDFAYVYRDLKQEPE